MTKRTDLEVALDVLVAEPEVTLTGAHVAEAADAQLDALRLRHPGHLRAQRNRKYTSRDTTMMLRTVVWFFVFTEPSNFGSNCFLDHYKRALVLCLPSNHTGSTQHASSVASVT